MITQMPFNIETKLIRDMPNPRMKGTSSNQIFSAALAYHSNDLFKTNLSWIDEITTILSSRMTDKIRPEQSVWSFVQI